MEVNGLFLMYDWYDQIDDNQNPLIIREISELKFPRLMIMGLRGNSIDSCEGISRIWMPQLAGLSISIYECM